MSNAVTRRRCLQLASAAMCLQSSLLRAQAPWPTRPIRFVSGLAPGGLTDTFARTYAEALSEMLSQPIRVESRLGAGGALAGGEIAKAAPDGHSFWIAIAANLNQNRLYLRKLPYDPDRDFAYVAAIPAGNLVLAVPGDSPARGFDELAERARQRRVSIGNFGIGSFAQMLANQLARRHRWQVDAVAYKGEAPMWVELAGGHLDAAIGTGFSLMPHVQSGRARALAVTQTARSPLLPEVPTFAELGLSDPVFAMETWVGILAPAGTPSEVVQRMSELIQQAGATPRMHQVHERFGIGRPWTAAEFERRDRADRAQWLALGRELNIEPE